MKEWGKGNSLLSEMRDTPCMQARVKANASVLRLISYQLLIIYFQQKAPSSYFKSRQSLIRTWLVFYVIWPQLFTIRHLAKWQKIIDLKASSFIGFYQYYRSNSEENSLPVSSFSCHFLVRGEDSSLACHPLSRLTEKRKKTSYGIFLAIQFHLMAFGSALQIKHQNYNRRKKKAHVILLCLSCQFYAFCIMEGKRQSLRIVLSKWDKSTAISFSPGRKSTLKEDVLFKSRYLVGRK